MAFLTIIYLMAAFLYLVMMIVRLSWTDQFPMAHWRDYIPFHEPTAHRNFDGSIEYVKKYHGERPAYPPRWKREADAKNKP